MSTQTLPRTPRDVRELIRSGTWRGVTSGIAPGYVQANLAILPRELAFDFLLFCQRNPKPCPVLEVMEPGRVEPALTAPSADIRTDVPGYRVYEDGRLVAEVESLLPYWRDEPNSTSCSSSRTTCSSIREPTFERCSRRQSSSSRQAESGMSSFFQGCDPIRG